MLERVLEVEAMLTAAEALDYDSMDHSAVNRLFVADLLAAGLTAGEVLDVGTGTAQLPIELCRQTAEGKKGDSPHLPERPEGCFAQMGTVPFFPAVRVLAVDLSDEMLSLARRNVLCACLTHRIRLEKADAKQLPYADGRFAAAISNGILHHIPEPRTMLGEMWRVVAPGGMVFVRDLFRPADEDAVQRLVAAYAPGANLHQRQMFAASFRAALSVGEVRTLVAGLGVAPDTVQATSDRHWTWCARK
jgi:ubiquinone/menaquinone biosynthesis C-methylase UbiE